MLRLVAIAALLPLALAARAQDFTALGGATQWENPQKRTYGWLLSYSHDLGDHLAASITYRNEGHVPAHHRDGQALQVWARSAIFSPDFTIAAGAGPYFYFDTTVAEGGAGYSDAHGWGAMYSLAATWRRRQSPWFYQLRVDHVETKRNLDTKMLVFGAGRRLDQDASFIGNSDWEDRKDTHNEVVISGGKTIVNSFESENADAHSVEFRHAFGPVLRGSLGWISEGDARLIRRNGIVAQGWLEPSHSDDRYTLGIGLGGYFAVDKYRAKQRVIAGIITMTVGYNVTRHWLARLSWHRITSTYDRDSDILLLGLGYRF